MTERHDDAVVVVVDLRGDGYKAAMKRDVAELQHDYVRRTSRGSPDSGRMLVIDDTADLVAHKAAYTSFRQSRSVRTLVVVACGRPPDDKVIELPTTLHPPDVAVLWAADPRGIGWRPGSAGNVRFVDNPADPDGTQNLAALQRVLQVPAVFDEVLETVRDYGDGVASPGLWVVLGRVGEAAMAAAQVQAIARLTAADDDAAAGAAGAAGASPTPAPGTSLPPDVDGTLRLLTGNADLALAGIGRVLLPQGDLVDSGTAATAHTRNAHALLLRLKDPFASGPPDAAGRSGRPGETVWAESVGAGRAIHTLTTTMKNAFMRIGGAEGLNKHREHELRGLGVAMVPVPAAEPEPVVKAFRQLTLDAMEAREPLESVSTRLRDIAERASPQGSTTYTDRVQQVCPPNIAARLSEPPRFPMSFANPWQLPIVFAGGALSAMWFPIGLLAGPLALAASVMFAVWLFWGRPKPWPKQEDDPRDISKWEIVFYGVFGAAGVGAGATVGLSAAAFHIWGWGLLTLVVGLFFLLAEPYLWWRWSAGRWRAALNVEEAQRALESLLALLVNVALNEWVLSNPRGQTARAAGAFAVAVETVREELATAATALAATGPDEDEPTDRLGVHPDVGYHMRDHSGELAAVAYDDITHAIRHVLDTTLKNPDRNVDNDIANSAARALRETMGMYAEHLRQRGILEAPPFGGPSTSPRRRGLADSVWRNSRRVQEIIRAYPDDPEVLQLVWPVDLARLDVSPSASRVVKFAPFAAREAGEASGGVKWTASQDVAGLVRLTELVPGSVRRVQDTES